MSHNIAVYRNLMGANEEWAEKTRELLAYHKVIMVNIIGSPGCGKTTLLEKSVTHLQKRFRFAVLEGDVETTYDAARLEKLGVPVAQLLTDGACHLEAKLVHHALQDLPLHDLDVVIVENVGNLVCPAEFDIGEHAKIAVLSVTEGEDKPAKYPLLFQEAALMVLSKTDLLKHLDFDPDKCRHFATRVNPALPIIETAASGQETHVDALAQWLTQLREHHF
jgi:hydrogenase nickel incorporation protein HypB